MSFNASGFNRSRKTVDSSTKKSVNQILICIINCYKKIITDGVVFDFSKRGTIKHEDFLRNRLVDDYLEKELNALNNSTIDYTVNKEVTEEYISLIDNILHPDPIDIQIIIKDFSLKDSMTDEGKTYFAIECKRLTTTVSEYIDDIKKFTERKYIKRRLRIEGQIGFIENKKWNCLKAKTLINENLKKNEEIIITQSDLKQYSLNTNFEGSFQSQHLKKDESNFKIYHLFLNYSKVVSY